MKSEIKWVLVGLGVFLLIGGILLIIVLTTDVSLTKESGNKDKKSPKTKPPPSAKAEPIKVKTQPHPPSDNRKPENRKIENPKPDNPKPDKPETPDPVSKPASPPQRKSIKVKRNSILLQKPSLMNMENIEDLIGEGEIDDI